MGHDSLYRASNRMKIGTSKLWAGVIIVGVLLTCGQPIKSSAVNSQTATDAYNDFNAVYVNSYGNGYQSSVTNTDYLYFWQQAEAIELVIDRYEVTHGSTEKDLINTMCNKFVSKYSDSWISANTWNDDLGRASEMLGRAYLVTGTSSFLTKAKYCFDTAYQRGWDTTYNGGGIWEQMGVSNPRKEALSTLNCGYAAAIIYMATGSQGYRSHAGDIYAWARSHLFNPSTGQVYAAIYPDGTLDTTSQVYNQGTMIDYARLLYKINSSNQNYFNDATAAVVYTKAHHTDSNGFIDSCAAQFSRGMGHFVVDNNLWNTTFGSGTSYYSWMWNNCNTGWGHRWTAKNISWNKINSQTPSDNSLDPTQCEGVVSLLQYTFMPH